METPQGDEYDVIVVGLGPGGEFAANKLARAGLSVLAIDKHLAGGECPFYGCVPSKLMMRGATAVVEAQQAPGVSGECDVRPDWQAVARRIESSAGFAGAAAVQAATSVPAGTGTAQISPTAGVVRQDRRSASSSQTPAEAPGPSLNMNRNSGRWTWTRNTGPNASAAVAVKSSDSAEPSYHTQRCGSSKQRVLS